jgi:hypothetical protein
MGTNFLKEFCMKLFLLSFVLISSSAFAQWSSSFNTKIHNKLSISGRLCKGGERGFGLDEIICEKNQWLVTVDNMNVCSDEGMCTEIAVPPFVAELERANVITITTMAFYDIVPANPVSKDLQKILQTYWVKDNLNGRASVVKKSR